MKKFDPYEFMDSHVYPTRYQADKSRGFGHRHIARVQFYDGYGNAWDGYMNMSEKEYAEYKAWRKENK